jgi:hypothetical protein
VLYQIQKHLAASEFQQGEMTVVFFSACRSYFNPEQGGGSKLFEYISIFIP